ncbi:MAG: 23S rRNA (adenine(2503)-C(2))-methyltransferase @ tRNA (adenine(37)-C(2))-methyltransferase, partial [uncultured Solirubrobacterales bacterium]
GPRPPRAHPRRPGRAGFPGQPGVGVDRSRRPLLRGDDQPPGGPARRARRRRPPLLAAPRARGPRPRRDGQGAVRHPRRPSARGRADALPRRPALGLPVEPVGLSADLHLLRHGPDEVRPQPHDLRDPRPGAALPPRRGHRPRRVHGHGRADAEPRRRARGLRAPARPRRERAAHRDLHRRLGPGHRAAHHRGPAGPPRAVAPRARGRAALGAHAGQRALSPVRGPRRLPPLVRGPARAGVRRVPDARRGQRSLRAGRRPGARARLGRRLQGQPDPLQPDRGRVLGLEPRGHRRLPRGPGRAGRDRDGAAYSGARDRRGVRPAGRARGRAGADL